MLAIKQPVTQEERLLALQRLEERLQRRINKLDDISTQYGWIRVGIFFGGLLLGLLVGIFTRWQWGIVTLIPSLVIFILVANCQGRVNRSLTRHKVWLHLKHTENARATRDWPNIPDAYTPGQSEEHPFEADLDVTGKHALHRLLNTAVSMEGTQRLRDWLLVTKPDLATIQKRQELVRELTPLSAFRTRLTMKATLATGSLSTSLDGKQLLERLENLKKPAKLWPYILFSHVLSLTLLGTLILGLLGRMPQYWLLVMLAQIILLMLSKEKRGSLFEDAFYLRDSLAQLHEVFSFLESYSFGQNRRLRQLCQPYSSEPSSRPSRILQKVQKIANAATIEKNGLLWLGINLLVPWDFYLAQSFNKYRAMVAARLPLWLETWFELKSLCSLATFAYLQPEFTLPNVHSSNDQVVPLQARAMGHPLLPASGKVVNDFTMDQLSEIILLTGSNMAGKSTFLRTVGINLILAYAGAPVNASSFSCGLFRVYTCIKISNSVTEGYSYFYAEVRRLRALLNELQRPGERYPLLFLIDEIFKGTNNRERQIGSEAYIRALIGKNCLGLLSTHDLELVKLADIHPEVINYHFREEVVDGQMTFDYLLREGPCPTTNALKIMQLEGLPVDGVM